jgi:DNA-binding transcriptional regulator of glucitol operon
MSGTGGASGTGGLRTPRWLLIHAAVVVLVVAFLALGWWQLNRAAAGNLLSYGYAFEWPFFAAFTIFVWVKEMRRARGTERPPKVEQEPLRRTSPRTGPAYDDSGDDELAAYNRYLAWRNENPHATRAEYPG